MVAPGQARGGVAWQEPTVQSWQPRQVEAALPGQAKGEAAEVRKRRQEWIEKLETNRYIV